MDLKSLNAPAIPVRHNRRTQLKPLSRLNGDWLPLLKKIRTSEMSQQVRGHNASEELRTRRLVGQWFGDFAWQIGKLKKAQGGAMTDLARLHLERRQLRRNMVLWRQEEARQQAEREAEREARRDEMDRVSREIERRTRQLQRESRRMSQRLNAALFPPQGRRGSRTAGDLTETKPALDSTSAPPSVVTVPRRLEAIPPAEQQPVPGDSSGDPRLPTPPRREPSNPMIKAKVLEVTKAGPAPLVRTRTKSDLSEEAIRAAPGNEEEAPAAPGNEEEAPAAPGNEEEAPAAPGNEEEVPAASGGGGEARAAAGGGLETQAVARDDPIEATLHSNRVLPPIPRVADPPPRRNPARARRAAMRCTFPPIAEDRDPSEAPDTSPVASSPSSSYPAAPSRRGHSDERSARASVAPEGQWRARRVQEYQQAVLREPYNVYRRDSRGLLRSLDHPPARPKFEEPSNRAAYRRSRLLRAERLGFDGKLQMLEAFTNSCVEEDMRLLSELQRPKPPPEEEKPRLDEKFDESRKLGPSDWMRVFIHSSLPEGADPDDPESLHHCRYLRRDADANDASQAAAIHPDQSGRRLSSWDPL